MKTLPYWLRGTALLALLGLAHQGRSQHTVWASTQATTAVGANSSGFHAALTAVAPELPSPLVPQPTADGWLRLAGTLPTHATYTADVLASTGRSLAHRTWHGLTAGPVQLALNLRTVPPGTYTLVLSQGDQQWQLPLVQR